MLAPSVPGTTWKRSTDDPTTEVQAVTGMLLDHRLRFQYSTGVGVVSRGSASVSDGRMSVYWLANSLVPGPRAVRILVFAAVAPALVLGSLTVQAILIHEHHGHDVHSHALTLGDLDACKNDPEHKHEEHDHDGRPADTPEDNNSPIVIVFDLPDVLRGVRGFSGGAVAVSGSGSMLRAVADTGGRDTANPSVYEHPWMRAPIPRAGSAVADILLRNHALLL